MRKGIVGVAIVLAVVVAGFGLAIVSSSNDPDVARAGGLVQYDSCDALLDGLQAQALEEVGPYGLEQGGGVARFAEGDVVAEELAPMAGSVDDSGRAEGEQGAAAAPTTTAPSAGGDTDAATESSAEGDDGGGEPGTDFSDTNVQEEGVDEPDVVKTDGERLITVVDGTLRIFDVTGDEPVELGSVDVPGDEGYEGTGHELLLSGDTALVLGLTYRDPGPIGRPIPIEGDDTFAEEVTVPEGTLTGDLTSLVEVDLSDPAAPEVVHEAEVEGGYTTARMVGDVARIVTSTYAPVLGFVYPSDGSSQSEDVAEQANRRLIEQSTLEQWLPQVVVDGGEAEQAVACEQVGLPEEPSGFGTATVVTVDLSEGLAIQPESAASVLGGSEVVYASAENLYVATTAWPDEDDVTSTTGVTSGEFDDAPADDVVAPPFPVSYTAIHRFALPADGAAAYEASGEVPGRMLSQFSFSEHEGNLRVATTVDESAGSVSRLTVLAVDDLSEVGSVGDIGRGEELFAVRMLGDVGYAVTFEQTDPLFTIDLADPTNPQVVGELEIPGYSSYLHPISDELLLGIGQAGTEDGVLTGTQVSLFDVSDPGSPQRIQQYEVAGGSSEAEYDHRAFLYWPETGLTVLPLSVYDYSSESGQAFQGAVGVHVAEDGITEVGRIVNPDPNVDCEVATPEAPENSGDDAPPPPETTVPETIPDDTDPSTPTTGTAPTTTVVVPEGEVEVEGTISEVPPPDDAEVPCTGEPIRRSIVIGDRVLTVSSNVVQTSDLTTLDPISSVGFAG